MFKLTCENSKGNVIDFTDETKWTISNVDGLNPPEANIVIDDIPNLDGGIFRSSRLNSREITITLNLKNPVERNRLDVYRVINCKQYIKVYVQTKSLNVYTEGYVETIECNNFTKSVIMQITIRCPSAYWQNVEPVKTILNTEEDLLEFPFYTMDGNPVPLRMPDNIIDNGGEFSVYNTGDVPVGFKFTYKPKEKCSAIMIKNKNTGRYIYVSRYCSGLINEQITINTESGQKGIYTEYIDPDTQEVVKKSIIGAAVIDEWLQMETGENTFVITKDVFPDGYVDTVPETDDQKQLPREWYGLTLDSDFYAENYATLQDSAFTDIQFTIEFNERWAGI